MSSRIDFRRRSCLSLRWMLLAPLLAASTMGGRSSTTIGSFSGLPDAPFGTIVRSYGAISAFKGMLSGRFRRAAQGMPILESTLARVWITLFQLWLSSDRSLAARAAASQGNPEWHDANVTRSE